VRAVHVRVKINGQHRETHQRPSTVDEA
jgi:hypothetical protein